MAVTKILAKSFRLDRLINYVINGDKTEDKIFVSAVGCSPDTAYKTMMETKRFFRSTDGVQAYHIIQSFMPNEVAPKIAHEIANRFVKRYLEGYEVVVGTHVDKEHIHNHIDKECIGRNNKHKTRRKYCAVQRCVTAHTAEKRNCYNNQRKQQYA